MDKEQLPRFYVYATRIADNATARFVGFAHTHETANGIAAADHQYHKTQEAYFFWRADWELVGVAQPDDGRTPGEDRVAIEISTDEYDRLRYKYDKAVADNADTFMFKGSTILTSYAKHLLEYMEGVLKKQP